MKSDVTNSLAKESLDALLNEHICLGYRTPIWFPRDVRPPRVDIGQERFDQVSHSLQGVFH